MTERVKESLTANLRFPQMVNKDAIPFFKLAATAIPGIDAIIPVELNPDSVFAKIDISGKKITRDNVLLLAYAANFLRGKSDRLREQNLSQEAIDEQLGRDLNEIVSEELHLHRRRNKS